MVEFGWISDRIWQLAGKFGRKFGQFRSICQEIGLKFDVETNPHHPDINSSQFLMQSLIKYGGMEGKSSQFR